MSTTIAHPSTLDMINEIYALLKQCWKPGGILARDFTGRPCKPQSKSARSWSLIGAMLCACPTMTAYGRCAIEIRKAAGTDSLSKWEDAPDRTKSQVLGVLEKAMLTACE